jgi:hypothetical protein
MERDEQRIAILLYLRALMAMLGVLNRQLVEPELALHDLDFGRVRVLEGNPDKAVRLVYKEVNLANRYVSELAAILIGDTVDEHKRLPCAIYEKIFLTLRTRQEGVKQPKSSMSQGQSAELKSESEITER